MEEVLPRVLLRGNAINVVVVGKWKHPVTLVFRLEEMEVHTATIAEGSATLKNNVIGVKEKGISNVRILCRR